MASTTTKPDNGAAAMIFAVFSVVCFVAFLSLRGSDLGKLGSLVGNLGGGPMFGVGIIDSLAGGLAAFLVLLAWFGTGTFISRFIKLPQAEGHSHVLELVRAIAIGAGAWSLVWFFLGLAGQYSRPAAAACVIAGVFLTVLGLRRVREARTESRVPECTGLFDKFLLLLIAVPVLLALISAAAPPIAKDTLLYHFSVPKAYIVQGSNAYIQGNIASYLSLGTEMHVVWARLLGSVYSERAGEIAGSVVIWTFFPLLLAAVFGWAREAGISRRYALIAVLMVASIPTAYHVASSGYIDVSLALFVTLAIYSLSRWWRQPSASAAICVAIFLGAALCIKLTTVFVIAAFALIVLLRARNAVNSGKLIASGFGALILAGAIASPWYLRTWAATESPVFPFYMSIWPGKADGWDVERSNLFQSMNSQYGGADVDKTRYLTAPFLVSVAAQPEEPKNYDGVLGVAFLIGLPLLLFALWKLDLPLEAKIAAGVAGVMFLFWVFSSAQLRYLLPIAPSLAIAIAAAAEASGRQLRGIAQYALTAAAFFAILTTAAWFCQKAPLRVALGGQERDAYLAEHLDYFSLYDWVKKNTPPDSRVWLINMRRDTYNIDRPVFSDYLFEDWTFRKLLWESNDKNDLLSKITAMGVKFVLTRHDFLLDPERTTIFDEKRSASENDAKLRLAKQFLLDKDCVNKVDAKFSLIMVEPHGCGYGSGDAVRSNISN